MIRSATLHDIPAIMAIGRETLERAKYAVALDEEKARYMVRRCLNDRLMTAVVAEKDGVVVGFVLAVAEEHFFSKDRYATDLVFCVLPEHRDQAVWLLRRFLRWAKQVPKIKEVRLGISSGLDDDGTLAKLYQLHGLEPVGTIHYMRLN